MTDPWWDDDEEEEDFEDDDDFEGIFADEERLDDPYVIYWPSLQPLTVKTVESWTARRHLVVDATPEEAYVYWELDMDGTDLAHWNTRIGRSCFMSPFNAVWESVDDSIRHLVSPEYTTEIPHER